MITDAHKAFVRDIAEAARARGMHEFSVKLTFAATHNRPGAFSQIEAHWQQGRHGSTAPIEIKLHEQVTVGESVTVGGTQVDVREGPDWCTYPDPRRDGTGCWSLRGGRINKPQDCNLCEMARWNRGRKKWP